MIKKINLLLLIATFAIEAKNYKLIETAAEFAEIDKTSKPAVVMFSASWCGPCKMMEPFFDEIAGENPDTAFFKVDTSSKKDAAKMEKIAEDYNVRGLPTTVFVNKGEEVHRTTGGLRKFELNEEFKAFKYKMNKPETTTVAPAPKPAPINTQPAPQAKVCKKDIMIPGEDWDKIKEVIQGLNKPEYNKLLTSAREI